MQLSMLKSYGMLLTVLLAPILGLAVCASAGSTAKSCCAAHCAMKNHHSSNAGTAFKAQHGQAPVSPCCDRQAPQPVPSESSAQIVTPVQLALLPTVFPVALQPWTATLRLDRVAKHPSLAPPLSLLCTLLI
jgi:hypothetical protein